MASRTARKGTSRYKITKLETIRSRTYSKRKHQFLINDDAIDQWNPEAKV